MIKNAGIYMTKSAKKSKSTFSYIAFVDKNQKERLMIT